MYHLFTLDDREKARLISRHFTETKAKEAQHAREKWRKKKGLIVGKTVIALCKNPGKEITTLEGEHYNVITH